MKKGMLAWSLPFVMLILVSAAGCQNNSESVQDPEGNGKASLTEEDVRRIFREELESLEQVKRRAKLQELLTEYSLADEHSDTMKYGNSKARFTLEMFSDVECPFCRQMYCESTSLL